MTKENAVITLPIYRVNAFISPDYSHSGNPAAVVILEKWLPDEILLSIANKINLSETAFLVGWQLRWFTPKLEVNLCGHATLATAFVLFNHLSVKDTKIEFETRSGRLIVQRRDKYYTLDFPATPYWDDKKAPKQRIEEALGTSVSELFVTHDRYVCIVDDYEQISMPRINVETQRFERNGPDFDKIAALPLPGLIVTACVTDKDDFDDIDFVSRYFAPAKGVDEDPVTGTSHCVLAPLWGQKLGKTYLKARQISARVGDIFCDWQGERVYLTGQAKTVSTGRVRIKGNDITIEITQKEKCVVLYRVGFLLEVEPELMENDQFELLVNNRIGEGVVVDKNHTLNCSMINALPLEPETMNCGRCEDCGVWTTDVEKPDAIPYLSIGTTVNDRLLCDICLPQDHPKAF